MEFAAQELLRLTELAAMRRVELQKERPEAMQSEQQQLLQRQPEHSHVPLSHHTNPAPMPSETSRPVHSEETDVKAIPLSSAKSSTPLTHSNIMQPPEALHQHHAHTVASITGSATAASSPSVSMDDIASHIILRRQQWVQELSTQVRAYGLHKSNGSFNGFRNAKSPSSMTKGSMLTCCEILSSLILVQHSESYDDCHPYDDGASETENDIDDDDSDYNTLLLILAPSASSSQTVHPPSMESSLASSSIFTRIELTGTELCDALATLAATASLGRGSGRNRDDDTEHQSEDDEEPEDVDFVTAIARLLRYDVDSDNDDDDDDMPRFNRAGRYTRLWLESCSLAAHQMLSSSRHHQSYQTLPSEVENMLARPFHIIIDRCVGRLAHHFASKKRKNSHNSDDHNDHDDDDDDDYDYDDDDRLPSWRVEHFFSYAIDLLRNSIRPCLNLLELTSSDEDRHRDDDHSNDRDEAQQWMNKSKKSLSQTVFFSSDTFLDFFREVIVRSLLNRYARSVAVLFGSI